MGIQILPRLIDGYRVVLKVVVNQNSVFKFEKPTSPQIRRRMQLSLEDTTRQLTKLAAANKSVMLTSLSIIIRIQLVRRL